MKILRQFQFHSLTRGYEIDGGNRYGKRDLIDIDMPRHQLRQSTAQRAGRTNMTATMNRGYMERRLLEVKRIFVSVIAN